MRHHRLPVKLFVLENGGYLSIRTTQQNFFGATIGSGPDDGVSFPDHAEVAAAYGIAAMRLTDPGDMDDVIERSSRRDGPIVCQVMLDPTQAFEPRIKSRVLPDGTIVSPALEDMFPFLDPEELAREHAIAARTRGLRTGHREHAVEYANGAGRPCCSTSTARCSTPARDPGRARRPPSRRHRRGRRRRDMDLSLPLGDMIEAARPASRPGRARRWRPPFDATTTRVLLGRRQRLPGGRGRASRRLHEAGMRLFVVTNKRATSAAGCCSSNSAWPSYLEASLRNQTMERRRQSQAWCGDVCATQGSTPRGRVGRGLRSATLRPRPRMGIAFIAVTSGAGPLGHGQSGHQQGRSSKPRGRSLRPCCQSVRGGPREPGHL